LKNAKFSSAEAESVRKDGPVQGPWSGPQLWVRGQWFCVHRGSRCIFSIHEAPTTAVLLKQFDSFSQSCGPLHGPCTGPSLRTLSGCALLKTHF